MLPSMLVATLLNSAPAEIDGRIDPSYGDDGRTLIGYLESDTPTLRGYALSGSGRTWMLADDDRDFGTLYLARLLADGTPDSTFGPAMNGQRRVALPAGLIANTQALRLTGSVIQPDGKPVLWGGLYSVNGQIGVYPGLVCRLAVAGNFDAGFGSGGCRTLRSFLHNGERCLVSDVAITSEDQLLVIGNCQADDMAERPFIARLTATGALDLGYAGGAGLSNPAPPTGFDQQRFRALVLDADDQAVVAAEFDRVLAGAQSTALGLRKFDGGGSPETGFGTAGTRELFFGSAWQQNLQARDLQLRPDGRLLLLGEGLGDAPLRPVVLLAQLQANGTLDASFGSNGLRIDDLDDQMQLGDRIATMTLEDTGRAVVVGQRFRPGAAALANAGTEFWLGVHAFAPPAGAAPTLYVSGDVATTGMVESPGLGFSAPFTVTPGQITAVPLHNTLEFPGNDSIDVRMVKLTSAAPVVVSMRNGAHFIEDAYAALPVQALGTEYRILGWGLTFGAPFITSQFAIVPTRNNTTITITPTVSVGARPAAVPYQLTLQAGQSYNLHGGSDDGPIDLTGTTISADKPIAVYAGHGTARNPSAVDFFDGMIDQQRPLDSWGRHFLLHPYAERSSGDSVRVLAHEAGTLVAVNGEHLTALAAGQALMLELTAPMQISTSRPVAVAQYMKGVNADPGALGDPFMAMVPPVEQWQRRYRAQTTPTFGEPSSNFLNIVAPMPALGAVTLNGTPLSAASFTAIGSSGYASTSVAIDPGSHVVNSPLPVGVAVYGMYNSGAYGYPAAAAPSGNFSQGAADDLILRYNQLGSRDPDFGSTGQVVLDHGVVYGGSPPSRDRIVMAIATRGTIQVGSTMVNGLSGQSLPLSYRLGSDVLLRDGFE